MNETTSLKTYTVVIRCSDSLIRIPEGRGILIAPMRSPHGDYELRVVQRSEQAPNIDTPIPRELWLQVQGPAPSMEAAVNLAVATASDYVRQLAFGANAWQGLAKVHLAYDSTAGNAEREFFQNWIIDERGLPRVARAVDADLMFALLVAISQLTIKDRSRVVRAVHQYTDALQHWKSGSEVYALAHLYMGVEAITPLVIKREVARRDLKDRKALELALNGPPADSIWLRLATRHYQAAGGFVPSKLDPWARREVVFRGDKATYRSAQRASNQLEHGLADHADIHTQAVKAVGKTAEYLREAVLDLLPLSSTDRDKLKTAPYSTPMNTGGFERRLLGTIVSDGNELALPDQAYPYVRWEFNLLDYKKNETGTHEMQLTQSISPVLAEGAKLTVEKVVFAGPSPMSHTNVEFDVKRGDAPREEVITKTGAHLSIDAPLIAEWAQLVGRYMLNANTLPQLARLWLTRLDPSQEAEARTLSFKDTVGRIAAIVAANFRLSVFQEECDSLWKEAIQAVQLREMLSVAFTGERGLVVPLMPPDGRASEMTEPAKLGELNDHTMQLAKKLATLLDVLVAALTADQDQSSTAKPQQ